MPATSDDSTTETGKSIHHCFTIEKQYTCTDTLIINVKVTHSDIFNVITFVWQHKRGKGRERRWTWWTTHYGSLPAIAYSCLVECTATGSLKAVLNKTVQLLNSLHIICRYLCSYKIIFVYWNCLTRTSHHLTSKAYDADAFLTSWLQCQ